MEEKKIRVAITHGDTNGIGYEVLFKAFEDPTILELCTPIVYGSPKVAAYHRKALEIPGNFTIVNTAADAHDGKVSLLSVFDEEVKVEIGKATELSGEAGVKALDKALKDYQEGLFDVLVTLPIDSSRAFPFSGQAVFVKDHLETQGKELPILIHGGLRIALATGQVPLREVPTVITQELIIEKATALHNSLRRDFRISNPRIAILGLNPQAGNNGMFGSEETDSIIPAIEELKKAKIQAFGPYAPEMLFGQGAYAHFDAILAMYHEQGLTPFRSLAGNEGIVYTAGLPQILTAPCHDAQLDMAGKGIADHTPTLQAIYTAIDIFRNRIEYDEPMANPLKKLYKERRDDSERPPRFPAFPKKKDNTDNTRAREQQTPTEQQEG